MESGDFPFTVLEADEFRWYCLTGDLEKKINKCTDCPWKSNRYSYKQRAYSD